MFQFSNKPTQTHFGGQWKSSKVLKTTDTHPSWKNPCMQTSKEESEEV